MELIPFNRPHVPKRSFLELRKVLASGHLSGDGPKSKEAELLLGNLSNNQTHFLTPSCSHALEICIRALDIKVGDEVILPSFNFTSAANAITLSGATPVFVDINPDTLCLDLELAKASVTARTKAVILVHYAGVGAQLDEWVAFCKKSEIALIEDNAHGLGGLYKGKPLGTFGDFSTQSFHETKNIQSGEGGSITFRNEDFRKRIEILREKGTDRSEYFRGQIDKYTWQDNGSSWIQSEILAALLVSQLKEYEPIQKKRLELWTRYYSGIQDWANANRVRMPFTPHESQHPAHMFYLVLPGLEIRTEFINHLRNLGIMSAFHYQPLHSSSAGQKLGRTPFEMPNTHTAANNLVRLPLWPDLSEKNQNRVIHAVRNFRIGNTL